MKIWHGINDADDLIISVIFIAGICALLGYALLWAWEWVTVPKPVKEVKYTVTVRNVETTRGNAEIIEFRHVKERKARHV